MYFFRTCATAGLAIALAATVIVLISGPAIAADLEASTVPGGHFLLKIRPAFFYTSAYFSEERTARNLTDVTGLLYLELPVQLEYGITNSFAMGAILPLGLTYQEEGDRDNPASRLTVRDFWITLKYRWLTLPVISATSLRVKVPVAEKEPWEDGLGIGDGQFDIQAVSHLDYFSDTRYWYVQLAAAYKYRFEKDQTKPFDELAFGGRAGYELFPDLRMRFYLYGDLTEFLNGEFASDSLRFFEKEGDLYTFGYGVSLWPRPTFRVDLTTGGDLSGTNRYRGMRWTIGFTKIL